jgi:hypothetical protein
MPSSLGCCVAEHGVVFGKVRKKEGGVTQSPVKLPYSPFALLLLMATGHGMHLADA